MGERSRLRFGDFVFERSGGLCRLRTAANLTLAASAAAIPGVCGVDTLGVPEATPPREATTQSMRLRFRSLGWFTAEPEAHFALGLTGMWRKANPWSGQEGLLVGRGLIVGNVSAAPNGGRQAPIVQIESFRAQHNALLRNTCSPRLDEGAWYALELHASTAGRIGYRLQTEAGIALAEREASDPLDLPPPLGGWWITQVFADRHPERDWRFEIADLEIAWD
jgi:hypothetical protein